MVMMTIRNPGGRNEYAYMKHLNMDETDSEINTLLENLEYSLSI